MQDAFQKFLQLAYMLFRIFNQYTRIVFKRAYKTRVVLIKQEVHGP